MRSTTTRFGLGMAGACHQAVPTAKRLCSSAPHGSLLPPCPVPYTSANQTRRPTASSFLGGKRFPASRISSSVDGRTPAGIDDTTTNYLN